MKIKRQLKFWWQRKTRGFDDSELWDLDITIMEFTLTRLKAFKKMERVSWPSPPEILEIEWEKYLDANSEEKAKIDKTSQQIWEDILDKMIKAHELWLGNGGLFLKNQEEAEYTEGMELYNKWFHALWD